MAQFQSSAITGSLVVSGSNSKIALGSTSGVSRIFTNSTNDIRFSTANTGDVLFLKNSNGFIGINTTSPAYRLDVNGSSIFRDAVRIAYDNPVLTIGDTDITIRYAATQFLTNGGSWFLSSGDSNTGAGVANSDLWITRANDGSDSRFRFHRDHYRFSVYSGSAQGVQLDAAGNSFFNGGRVGIGTTTPSEELHVVGEALFQGPTYSMSLLGGSDLRGSNQLLVRADGSYLRLASNNNNIYYQAGSDHYFQDTNQNTLVTIKQAGNVGIGTTAPVAKLDVRGSMIMSGSSSTFTAGTLGSTRINVTQGLISGYYAAEAYARFLIGRDVFAGGQAGIALGGAGGYSYIGTDGTSGNALIFSTDGNNVSGQGNTYEKMRIDSSGRLLINATSTAFSDKLYINNNAYTTGGWRIGTATTYVGALQNSGGAVTLLADTVRDIQFTHSNYVTPSMFIEGTTQKVGIGTTAPSQKLEVEGNISASGDLHIQNNQGLVSKNVAGADRTLIQLDNANVLRIKGNDSEGSANAITMVAGGNVNFPADVTVQGIVTAKEFHTEFVSASIVYQSGSTKFGDTLDDNHSFTGSIYTTGSLEVNAGAATPFIKGDAFRVAKQTNGAFGKLTLGTINHLEGDIGNFRFKNNTTTLMYISGSGNVGIGTLNPTTKLLVAGTTALGSDFAVNNPYTNKILTPSKFSNGAGDSLSIATQGTSIDEGPAILLDGRNFTIGSYDNGAINSGIRFNHINNTPNSDTVEILAASNVQMTISASGHVGIGTTTPQAPLDVNGDVRVKRNIYGADGNYIGFFADGGSGLPIKARSLALTNDFNDTAPTNGLYVKGDAGIGTTSPESTLDVRSAAQTDVALIAGYGSQPNLIVGTNTGYTRLEIATGSYHHTFYTRTNVGASSERFTIEGGAETARAYFLNSNVGIGTTNPTEKLEVSGNVKATKLLLNTTNTGYTLYSNGESRINGVIFDQASGIDYLQKASGTGALYVRNSVSGQRILVGAANSSGQFTNYLEVDGANNDATIRTNDVDRLYISSSGNVGIGTTSPNTELHVSAGEAMITVEGSNASYINGAIQLISNHASNLRGLGTFHYVAHTDVEWFAGLPYNDNDAFVINRNTNYTTPSSQTVPPGKGASEGRLLTLDSTGRLGIGTSVPAAELDVNGSIKLSADSSIFSDGSITMGIDYNNNQTDRVFRVVANNSTEVFRVQENGNVGIGKTTPTSKLDVAGAVRALGLGSYFGNSATSYSYAVIGAFSNGIDNIPLVAKGYSGQTADLTRWVDSSNNILNVVDASGNVGIGNNSPNAKLAIGNSSYNGNLAVAQSSNNNRVALIGNLEIVNNSTGGTWSGQSIYIPGANRTFGFRGSGALNAADSSAFEFNAVVNNNRTVDYTSFNLKGGYSTNTLAADYTFMKIDGNIFQGGINQSGSITGIDYNPSISQLTGSHTAMRLRSGDVLIEDGDLTVGGTITAREFKTEFVSASIVYQSGSTKFGDTADDVHQFTGSLRITNGTAGDELQLYQLSANTFRLGSTSIGEIWTAGPSNRINFNQEFHSDVRGGSFDSIYTGSPYALKVGASGLVVTSGSYNVGIGTTSPTKKLDVRGSMLISGSFSGADANALVLNNTDSSGNPSIMRMIFSGEGGNEALQIGMFSSPTVKPVYFQSTQGSGWGNIVFQKYGGSVGIGTDSPTSKLTVAGNIEASGSALVATNNDADSVGLSLVSPSSGVNVTFDFEVGDTGISGLHAKNLVIRGSSAASDIAFSPSTSYPGMMLLDGSTGRVGIGTVTPSAQLHISSSGTPLKMERVGYDIYGFVQSTGTGLQVQNFTDNRTEMFFKGDGTVGIGTTSPSYTLDVHKTGNAFRVANSGGYATFTIAPGNTVPILMSSRAKVYASLVSSNNFETLEGFKAQGYKAGGNHSAVKVKAIDAEYGTDYNSTGSLDYAAGVYSNFNTRSTGSGITNIYGFYSTTANPSSTPVTNQYGLYIADTTVATNNYGIYQAGSTMSNVLEGDLTVGGIVTAKEFHTEFVSASIVYQSGSTKFGDTSDDVHQFTGSVEMKNNLNVDGMLYLGTQDGFVRTEGIRLDLQSNLGIINFVRGANNNTFASFSGHGTNGSYLNTKFTVGTGTATGQAKLHVSGTSDVLLVQGSGSTLMDVQGSQGQLFSVVDSLSGSLMSVNDISGLPIMEVFSDDTVVMGEYGTNALVVTGSRVGIGTSTPSTNVEIGTNGGGENLIRINSDIASSYLEIQSLGNVARLKATNNTNLLLQSDGAGGYITFNANSAERMRIAPSGNVGIGTTAPSYKLQVNADGEGLYVRGASVTPYTQTIAKFEYGGNVNSINIENQGGKASIQARDSVSTMDLYINPVGGNVGIGTTSPSYKLEVAGTVSGSAFYGDGQNLTNVQRIPKVEYATVATAIATNDEITLPNGLEFTVAANGFEYLEIFVDGIRLNRTIDYAEVDPTTVRYLLNIPVDSVITYKSLTLV